MILWMLYHNPMENRAAGKFFIRRNSYQSTVFCAVLFTQNLGHSFFWAYRSIVQSNVDGMLLLQRPIPLLL